MSFVDRKFHQFTNIKSGFALTLVALELIFQLK